VRGDTKVTENNLRVTHKNIELNVRVCAAHK